MKANKVALISPQHCEEFASPEKLKELHSEPPYDHHLHPATDILL